MDSPGGITALIMLQSRTAAASPEGTKLWRCSNRGRENADSTWPSPPSEGLSLLNLKSGVRRECGAGAAWRVHGGSLFLRGGTPRACRQAVRGRPGGGPPPIPGLIKSWIFQGKGVKHASRRLSSPAVSASGRAYLVNGWPASPSPTPSQNREIMRLYPWKQAG